MVVRIKIDAGQALDLVQRDLPKAVPYVAASMLTGLSGTIQQKITSELPVAFDRPTPFTQRSVFTRGATSTNLTSEVYFPESQEQMGRSRREYIRPGAEGASARRQKRSEALLVRSGVLPSGWVTVPGRYAMANLLDGYGNMKGQYYRQIIRNLQLKAYTGSTKAVSKTSIKRAARMGVENEFFAVTPGKNALAAGGGWLPPGVYKREGRGGRTLRQYLKFVRKASYRKRLDMESIAQREVSASFETEFGKAYSQVIHRFVQRAATRAGLA